MRSTEITVPKDQTFKLPEGRFKAKISGFKVRETETSRGMKKNAVILFGVEDVPRLENYECLARKVLPFDLKVGSELRRFTTGLLGSDFFTSKSNQCIDLEVELVGKLCEVVLFHAKHDNDKYSFPLVDVEAMYPRIPEPTPLQVKTETDKFMK